MNRTPEQQAEWAGREFDKRSPGRVAMFFFGRRVYFVPPHHMPKALRMHARMPGSRLLDLQHPAARTQFIAWACTRRRDRKAT